MRTQTERGLALGRAREETDALFRLVRSDSLYERPIAERHRIVFYIGHLEAFDWNLVGRYALDKRSFHPEFDRLFAFGIDPPPGELPSDRPADWPGLQEVERYTQRIRDEIDDVLDEVPEQLWHVAMEHRLMHAETLAYMLHNLPYEKKVAPPVPLSASAPGPVPVTRMIGIPAGAARLGRDPGEGFGWDNEFQAHTVEVPAFAISRYKVTNGEYLQFVRQGAAPPYFWVERDGDWFYRGMFAEIPLPLDWPVYATSEEAAAFARWRGMRLPSEPEFHRAAGAPPASGNFDFRHWDPVPVTSGERAGREALPEQMFGNGWEWTSSAFAPFPGFEPFPFYTNYSAPFFDGRHHVLKGASPRTAACFLRTSFRNWFRPSYPYLYAGFRLAAS
ncbi:MAG: SUMF1/EgtB/PvdO family nonheme iron enzyme [Acidobacteriia bacterium]|nr:SUMF1/EgtB/PvdO family nonheme iron enzyme [Terriglobia bacterium]